MQGRHKGRLVTEGARVAILDVGDCAATVAQAQDIAKTPGSVAGFKCDIGSTECVAAAVTALLGFVRGLATEVGGQGITVNALAPGLTRTSTAIKGVPQQHFDFVVSRQAVKRSGEPEDQAAAVSFLVSDDAAFMSGQTLLVDGGEGHV